MVAGINTDVEHEGHVYHVQTEDLSGATRKVESLVFEDGEVLARLAFPYRETAAPDVLSTTDLRRVLERQHWRVVRRVCRGIIVEEHSADDDRGNGTRVPSWRDRCSAWLDAARRRRYAIVFSV